MLTLLVFAIGLVLWLAPDTPLARQLRKTLVERPAERLSRVRPGAVLLILLLAAVSAAILAIAKSEGALLVAQGLPEALASFAALDVATYFDVLAVAWLFGASVRLRALRSVASSGVAHVRRWIARRAAPRRRAQRSRPAAPRAANPDDEGWPAFPLAA
jgi:hypothetical protein